MPSLKLQPTFTLNVPLPTEKLLFRIRRAIQSPELRGHAISAGSCVDFKINEKERHFWSPHLSVQVYEAESESGSELYCRFSPRPEVWTMVMFFYFLASFTIFAAAIYGYVQSILGQSPWALLVIPICVLLIVALHVASLIGQRLSNDEMRRLRERLDRTIALALDPSPE